MIDNNHILFNKFLQFFNGRKEWKGRLPYAVAVSGGIDSVVLCDLCSQAKLDFIIVHCNFQLRDQESERDKYFVSDLAKKYNVEALTKNFDTVTYAREEKLSIQEAARNLRYGWFRQLHLEDKVSFTLLAHHANDNVESVLMNFYRGTGLAGLTGMPEVQEFGHCLRPLLKSTRSEIEEYAQLHQLEWMEDSSNKDEKYTRNFFRNTLLPQLKKFFPQVEDNILHNIDRLRKTEVLYGELLSEYKKKIGRRTSSGSLHLPVQWLTTKKNSALVYEIIRDFGFGEKAVSEFWKLMESKSGKYISNENYKIIKHRKWIIIAPNISNSDPVPIDKNMEIISFGPNLQMELKMCTPEKILIQDNPREVQLDAMELEWPLLLRKWKQGDYFYPLGMRKKKKIARFLIDAKLSRDEKEQVWVLESAKRIIWVVGLRIDDRFKITQTTKSVLKLTLSNL